MNLSSPEMAIVVTLIGILALVVVLWVSMSIWEGLNDD